MSVLENLFNVYLFIKQHRAAPEGKWVSGEVLKSHVITNFLEENPWKNY